MSTDIYNEEVFGEEIDTPPTFEAISHVLGVPRKEVLEVLYESDHSPLHTKELREETYFSDGTALHHLEQLRDWDLVKEGDRRAYHGHGGRLARTWELTPRGWEYYLIEIADHETVIEELGPQRQELLKAFYETDQPILGRKELHERTSVPEGSIRHHLEKLTSWNVVEEQTPEGGHDQGVEPARKWELTPRWADRSLSLFDEPSDLISAERMTDHEERLEVLEDDIERIGTLVVKVAIHTGTLPEEEGQELLERRGWDGND